MSRKRVLLSNHRGRGETRRVGSLEKETAFHIYRGSFRVRSGSCEGLFRVSVDYMLTSLLALALGVGMGTLPPVTLGCHQDIVTYSKGDVYINHISSHEPLGPYAYLDCEPVPHDCVVDPVSKAWCSSRYSSDSNHKGAQGGKDFAKQP